MNLNNLFQICLELNEAEKLNDHEFFWRYMTLRLKIELWDLEDSEFSELLFNLFRIPLLKHQDRFEKIDWHVSDIKFNGLESDSEEFIQLTKKWSFT